MRGTPADLRYPNAGAFKDALRGALELDGMSV